MGGLFRATNGGATGVGGHFTGRSHPCPCPPRAASLNTPCRTFGGRWCGSRPLTPSVGQGRPWGAAARKQELGEEGGGRPPRCSGPCLRRAGGSTSPPAMCGCLGVALHAGSPVATRQRLSEGDLLLDSAHAATARGRTRRPQHPPYTPSRWVPDAASRAPLGCWAQARGTARWGLCHPAIPTVPCTTMAATMPSEVAVVPEPPLWAPVLGRPA